MAMNLKNCQRKKNCHTCVQTKHLHFKVIKRLFFKEEKMTSDF